MSIFHDGSMSVPSSVGIHSYVIIDVVVLSVGIEAGTA